MKGETNLETLLKTMKPKLNNGEFVFCCTHDISTVDLNETVLFFKEEEAFTIIIKKEIADSAKLTYSGVFSWITLTVHSSLEAVGLTSAFSKALSDNDISCNVVAAFYHDHIFVKKDDAEKAMEILRQCSA